MGKPVTEVKEALEIINNAAREGKEDLKSLIENYANLKEIFGNGRENAMTHKWQENKEKLQEKFDHLDTKVHENPWPFIGGVTVVALLIGYIMGNSRD